jgi:hypothetical protein
VRKRHPSVAAFEDEMTRSSPPDVAANRRVFEAMYRYAVGLGVFPLRDPLEGIEVDVRLAKALHVRSNPRPDRASA